MASPTKNDVNDGAIELAQPDIDQLMAEGVFPSPLKVIEEPADETNEHLPGALVLNKSGKLLKRYITWEGFGDHHIEIYDHWILHSAKNNVYMRTLRMRDGRIVCFENLRIMKPHYTRDGKTLLMTPQLAREQGVTYGGDWYVDVVLKDADCTDKPLQRINDICIGTVPTMLKSQYCILHMKTPRELALFGEDPSDPGGYFIVDGVEKVIMLQEQLAVNKMFLMNMSSKGSVVARMTANTPRGTALIELALDKKTKSIIKIRFPSMKNPKRDTGGEKNKKIKKYGSINVLSVFRIFGMTDPAAHSKLDFIVHETGAMSRKPCSS